MTPHYRASLSEAYSVLGLDETASIETVKSTYRQIALKTHPDKNPSPDATERFQRVGEAYNTVLKHLQRQENGYGYDEYDSDDYYDDDSYSDEFEDLDFYMFLFAQFMRSQHSHRYYSHSSFRRQTRKDDEPVESRAEYDERLKRNREEYAAAQERRKQEQAARKARQEEERERERLAAEARQKARAEEKRAQAAAQQKKAEASIRNQQMKTQRLRSAVFRAARGGDVESVKKGIWEDEVDAAGGEINPGCQDFVKVKPQDAGETLLHIAACNGNSELVEWLDTHNADVEERNSEGLTAFHCALRCGHVSVVNYLLDAYPPSEIESQGMYFLAPPKSLLSLAVESNEPQLVYILITKEIADKQQVTDAWSQITLKEKAGQKPRDSQGAEKFEDIKQLLTKFGGLAAGSSPSNLNNTTPPKPRNNEYGKPQPNGTPLEDAKGSRPTPQQKPQRNRTKRRGKASRGSS